MKKIINGKKYDTETATKVAEYWNGRSTRDFYYLYEELYRKKTGEFFLFGSGGAATNYAMQCGSNTWCGNQCIIPLSVEAAKKFAEKNCTADEYEKIFGEVEE